LADGSNAWIVLKGDRLRVRLKVQPSARQQGVKGVEADATGASRLVVQVNAPPVDGKANGAVMKLLAKRWGVSPSLMAVVSGATARQKVREIAASSKARLDKICEIEGINTIN